MATERLYGRNAVLESLRAGRRQHVAIQILDSIRDDERINEILERARQLSLRIDRLSRDEIDRTCAAWQSGRDSGDGAISICDELGDLQPEPDAIVLALDELEDPRNAGSLMRTAEAAGVTGVIFPERRSVEVTPAVVNASSGAAEHLQIWQEKNLARWLTRASDLGYWIIGLDGGPESENLFDADLPLPAVLVVGSEGRGLRRLTGERCDMLVRIPMYGEIESLNAAAAGSIALYHLREYGG